MLREMLVIAGAALLAGAEAGMAQPDRSTAAPSLARVAAAGAAATAPLPADWRVGGLDGTLHPLSEWRGRVVVLNLWASWCAPCVGEMESFRALRESLHAEGLADGAVALLLLTPEPARRVARFVGLRLPDMPVFVEHDPLPATLGVRAVPTTWILDRDGQVVMAHRGVADWNSPDVRALLRSLASADAAGGRPR